MLLNRTSSGQTSKFLVSKRSWQADLIRANFLPTARLKSIRSADSDQPRAGHASLDDLDSGLPLASESRQTVDIVKFNQTYGDPTDLPVDSFEKSELDLDESKLREFLNVHGFRWYQLVFFCISVGSYLADIISDAYLVYTYYRKGDYYWSGLTMALMIVPALLMTSFSLVWYLMDRKVNVDPPRTCRAWTLRLLFHGLQLAPLVRSVDAIYYGILSRKHKLNLAVAVQYTQLMLYEDADCAMLRMIECFTEAAPQLLLQLYIILTQNTPVNDFQITVQVVSCILSWISLAWSLTHYQSALRSSRIEKSNMPLRGLICFILWKAGMLGSRILALAMLASLARGLWFSLAIGLHWVMACGWLIARGTTFCSAKPRTVSEILFDCVLGAVYCFDVVNIREGHSRLWYLACYSILGLENCLIAWVWWVLAPLVKMDPNDRTQTKWFLSPNYTMSEWLAYYPNWMLSIVVGAMFGFGLIMMMTYYIWAHPSGRIRICVPLDELITDPTESVNTPEDADHIEISS